MNYDGTFKWPFWKWSHADFSPIPLFSSLYRFLCNDWTSWNAYGFDLWPFCGANRVPDIIIPCSLIIFPTSYQPTRQPKPLFQSCAWQVSAFPDYYTVILWLSLTRPTSSCVLQLKSDGPQVELGYSVAAVCLLLAKTSKRNRWCIGQCIITDCTITGQ